jgi:uncharacterized membrane protein
MLNLSSGPCFSEIYLLNVENQAKDFPFAIQKNQLYALQVGVANSLGASTYYQISIKLCTQSNLPNRDANLPSNQQPIYQYRQVLRNGSSVQLPLNFSVYRGDLSENQAVIQVISVNGLNAFVSAVTDWNSQQEGYYFWLVAELWVYNSHAKAFEYDNRFVALPLNVTVT